MNRICKLIILIAISSTCDGQNLVPNPSFEQYSGCPSNVAQLDSTLFWINPTSNIFGTSGTPDYLNQCATGWVVGVPVNAYGYQQAHSGIAYSLIALWDGVLLGHREYIEVPLGTTLTANTCYHFEMYVNLIDNSSHTTSALGVYFSNNIIAGINNYYPLPFVPQIENNSLNYFDTLNWNLVSGNYSALGGENHLIIGNFNNDSNTTTVLINSALSYPQIGVYIDDVSLTPCTGFEEQYGNSGINIYPNPVTSKLIVNINSFEISEITLYDITNREAIHKIFSKSIEIDFMDLAKGIYLYEISNKNGIIKQGKILKE